MPILALFVPFWALGWPKYEKYSMIKLEQRPVHLVGPETKTIDDCDGALSLKAYHIDIVGILLCLVCIRAGDKPLYRLSTSLGISVRFWLPYITGESCQFIHTVTAEALTLPLGDV